MSSKSVMCWQHGAVRRGRRARPLGPYEAPETLRESIDPAGSPGLSATIDVCAGVIAPTNQPARGLRDPKLSHCVRTGGEPSLAEARRRQTTVFLFAFAIGVVAGLRAMTAPALVSWAARFGWVNVAATPLAFLGYM